MVLTYNQPAKEWNLKPGMEVDGDSLSYQDMMERQMNEEHRRQRERAIMEDGRAMWQQKKREQFELELKEQDEIRELAHVHLFGKPGHGAPTEDIRKKKFTEYQLSDGTDLATRDDSAIPDYKPSFMKSTAATNGSSGTENGYSNPYRPPLRSYDEGIASMRQLSKSEPDIGPDAMTFGRPGCGAPVRTRSGRLRTTLIGNPEIRFQPNESVQKTIVNSIRYMTDRGTKEEYQRVLEEQISERKSRERSERDYDRAVAQELSKYEGNQWGRPGPGGPYWRERTVTGQGFFEKMGWSGSADPRRRAMEIKHIEAEDMKREMDEVQQRKYAEYDDLRSNVGVELVPLLKDKATGKPRKDPATGYMMSHALSTTDVTRQQDPTRTELPAYPRRSPMEDRASYYHELANQVVTKHEVKGHKLKQDEEQSRAHYNQMDTYWGRPGYGAPKGPNIQKENLMKTLYYPHSQSPTNVELITLERLPIKP